jgi:hypothetical protein
MAGCSNDSNKVEEEDEDVIPIINNNQNAVVNVNGEIFSIPSPIETSILLKNSGAIYNKTILNPASKLTQYTTNLSKAINLGIYGADLGYVTMYEQAQDAIGFLNASKKLADELNITGAFDTKTIERFQKNIGNKDSMLVLVSVAYRASDSYLKNNNRNDISALVLAGGWIESLYFATEIYKAKPNDKIKRRIAEQKASLSNLIKLLTQYYNQSEYVAFIDSLNDLASIFEKIEFTYIYEKPITDVNNKTTTITSKSDVVITNEQIESIAQKIKIIRTNLVQ